MMKPETLGAAVPGAITERELREGDMTALLADLRDYDREVWRDVSDTPPEIALANTIATAAGVRVFADELGVLGMIGLSAGVTPGVAYPWLAATSRFPRSGGQWVARNVRRVVAELDGGRFKRHVGAIPTRSEDKLRFAEFCGYRFGPAITAPSGASYILFEGEAQCLGSQ